MHLNGAKRVSYYDLSNNKNLKKCPSIIAKFLAALKINVLTLKALLK